MSTTIDRYQIEYELGSGGFGTVYAALDTELGRRVAIKQLRADISANPALVERFLAEAKSLARLNHPNITTLYDRLQKGDEWFLVMELVQGQPLDKILQRLRRLEPLEALSVVVQTAAGLGYANRMGVIHRDIKPSNLMLTDTGQVKIMDFGIARVRGTQRLTRSGLLGTYAYLAPEQFRGGEGTEQSDMYALACVVYEMLSGDSPFNAPTEAEMMRGHLELPARSLRDILPAVEPRVDMAVQRALAKDPTARFASAEEFSDALGASALERQAPDIVRTRILGRMPPPSRPTTLVAGPTMLGSSPVDRGSSGSGAVPRPSGHKRRLRVVAIGTACFAAAAGLGYVVFGDPSDTGSPSSSTGKMVVNEPPSQIVPPGGTPSSKIVQPIPPPVVPSTAPQSQGQTFIPRPNADTKAATHGNFIDPPTESAESLMKQADQALANGQVANAQALLRKAKEPPYNSIQALIRLAHLDDPTRSDRPTSYTAKPNFAALYYMQAVKMSGDKPPETIVRDRESLRLFLEAQKKSGDSQASGALETYWK